MHDLNIAGIPYESGIAAEGRYERGEEAGTWRYWNEDGRETGEKP